jgi:hypothetical protein
MKKPYFVIVKICLFFSLVSCTPSLQVTPVIIADKLVIKVGETISITVTAPTKYVTLENQGPFYTSNFLDTAFIYTPTVISAPNTNDIKGPYSGNAAQDSTFLLDSDIEVVSPSGFDVTLPPRITAVHEGDSSKVTFGIRGKSVGTAVIRAGFLSEILSQPYKICGCGFRIPLVEHFDGIITIQVVP